MAMHPTVKRLVEILTEDVKRWENAAESAERLIPHVPEPDREHWKDVAAGYRANAEEYKSMIKQYLEENEPEKPAR